MWMQFRKILEFEALIQKVQQYKMYMSVEFQLVPLKGPQFRRLAMGFWNKYE